MHDTCAVHNLIYKTEDLCKVRNIFSDLVVK